MVEAEGCPGGYYRGRRLTAREAQDCADPDRMREDDPTDLGPRVGARSSAAQGVGGVDSAVDLPRSRLSPAGGDERRTRCLTCGARVSVAQDCARVVRCARCPIP